MHTANTQEISELAAAARARAVALGLTQTELARVIGVEQSQVSRLLSGNLKRRTAVFDALCEYLGAAHEPRERSLPPGLSSAVLSVWDGSKEHAEALATVIRSLAALGRQNQRGT